MIQEIVNGYSMLQIVLIAEYVLDAVSCREVVKHYWFVQYFYVTKEIKSKWTSNHISIGCKDRTELQFIYVIILDKSRLWSCEFVQGTYNSVIMKFDKTKSYSCIEVNELPLCCKWIKWEHTGNEMGLVCAWLVTG